MPRRMRSEWVVLVAQVRFRVDVVVGRNQVGSRGKDVKDADLAGVAKN